MQLGDEWVYRLRDGAPSERVRIIEAHEGKRSYRADVEFLDREPATPVANVPGKRLRAPWEKLEEHEAIDRAWTAVAAKAITDVESNVIDLVYTIMLSREIATREWQPAMAATAVHDLARLEGLLGCPSEQSVVGAVDFKPDEMTIISPESTLAPARIPVKANWVSEPG